MNGKEVNTNNESRPKRQISREKQVLKGQNEF